VAGFTTDPARSISSNAGAVKLGELSFIPENPLALGLELSLIGGKLGTQISPSYSLAIHQDVSETSQNANLYGTYAIVNLGPGQYDLNASKRVDAIDQTAIDAEDALAAIKIAVGKNPNPVITTADDTSYVKPLSPYQLISADANQDGRVNVMDALDILKYLVKKPTSYQPEWDFLEENIDFWETSPQSVGTAGDQVMNINRHVIQFDRPSNVDLSPEGTQSSVNWVGLLRGDVDGSWRDSGSTPSLDISYFNQLNQLYQIPIHQWG
jgi:hypothetical protein